VHEGAIGIFGTTGPRQHNYANWRKTNQSFEGTGGWVGITDQYWLAAVVPNHDAPMRGEYIYAGDQRAGTDVYDVRWLGPAQPLPNNGRITSTVRFYAGAKEAPLLTRYERGEFAPRGVGDARISRFHTAVDWGFLAVLTQPTFWLLDFLYRFIGDFGLAILALTVVVKLIFFPAANMSFESMTKIKKAQPELERIRAQYKDDPAAQQREMMALYQRERINPLMGCLPMLIQIPVFYALYKVLTVTIEMRHAPFFSLIPDLSARDPTSIWNLFGLLPFNPAALPGVIGQTLDGGLHVGIFAVLYGFTMWLSQSMAPQAGMDPMQRRMLQFMPLIFTFFLSQLAVGLMIYYSWSNVLSILQQWVIMRRYKVENPIDGFLARFSRPKAAE
jgi:YidC/Oxa1 family membrane protein insertase